MVNSPSDEPVPEGAAVFHLIPEELEIHPLTLAVLHALVFLEGSAANVVSPPAAEEALEYLAGYLQRLRGPDLQRVREDLECLAAFARQEEWDPSLIEFLKTFLKSYGVGGRGQP